MTNLQESYRTLLEAASFAARADQGQVRKDGKTPYASHPCRVAVVLRHVFGIDDNQAITAALLHDTLEDTTTDFDDLAERFGLDVADWVAALSKDKRLPDDEREAAYIRHLQQAPWQVHVCKLADMFDNLMDCATMERSRHDHVLKRVRSYLDALKDASRQSRPAWLLAKQLYDEIWELPSPGTPGEGSGVRV